MMEARERVEELRARVNLEMVRVPDWYPLWAPVTHGPIVKLTRCKKCKGEKIDELYRQCDKGIWWIRGGKRKKGMIDPPEDWESKGWVRWKKRMQKEMGDVEHK